MWLLPRGQPMYFQFGRRRMGLGKGIVQHVLCTRVCSPQGAFGEGVKANPFRANLPARGKKEKFKNGAAINVHAIL